MFELGDKVFYPFTMEGKEPFSRSLLTGVIIRISKERETYVVVLEGGGILETYMGSFQFVEHCSQEELLTHTDERVREIGLKMSKGKTSCSS